MQGHVDKQNELQKHMKDYTDQKKQIVRMEGRNRDEGIKTGTHR